MTTPATTGRCPVPHGMSHRKTGRDDASGRPAIERVGDTWRIRSHAAVRQVLRASGATRQAGFNAEAAGGTALKQPVLFQDGEEHRRQRTAIARFFTPATVGAEYRELMEELADRIVAELEASGGGDLDALTLELAVQVAARIVGLTHSRRPGMDRRLDALLSLDRLENASPARRAWVSVRSWTRMFRFYWMDVRPAIAAHRRTPQEDVIGHLLEHEYNHMEVLIECITYGAAGMATTREFLCMAAWHLLEDDDLRAGYLAASETERHRILQEILRLEPVVGKLYRRTTETLRLESDGVRHEIPAGALVELDIRAANADPLAVGEDPLALCPQRNLASGVLPPVMSFGDGVHRCPGAFVAIQETDVFLTRLLALPLRAPSPPRLAWNELIESYEIRGFAVEVDRSSAAGRGAEARDAAYAHA